MSMVDATPFDAFEPSLERYFNLHSLLVRSLDDNAVNRTTSVSSLGDFAKKLLSESAVRRLQRLIAPLLELNLLQFHGEIRGSRGTQDSLKSKNEAVIRQVSPA